MLFQISSEVTNDCNDNMNSHFSSCFYYAGSEMSEKEKKIEIKSLGVIFPGVECTDLAPEPFRVSFQDQGKIQRGKSSY